MSNGSDDAAPNDAAPKPPEPSLNFKLPMRFGWGAFAFLFGVVFLWFALAPMASAVIATGTVIVRGRPQLVQHLDGGIVREIFVRNGSFAKKGDLLVRLDETVLLANIEIYRNRLKEASARQSRLESERDELESIVFNDALIASLHLGNDAVHREGQKKLFEARRMSKTGQIAQLREKISQLSHQIAGVDGVAAARREQLGYIEKELEGLRFLQAKGIASQTRVLAQERARAELVGQLAEYSAERARIENTISETEINILQVQRQFNETVLTELREAANQVDDLVQQIVATTKQLERIEIRAPVTGVVHELSIHTVGGVIPPGATLMQLISEDEGMEIEVSVETQSIDQLYLGQPAVIRFPAFNQRTTPELFGKVERISPTSVVDEKTGFAFYRVALDVPKEQIDRLGDHKLVPGMPAEAHVQTEERTPLNYLLKPLLDQFNKAMRES